MFSIIITKSSFFLGFFYFFNADCINNKFTNKFVDEIKIIINNIGLIS